MHKYKITYLTNVEQIVEDAELSWNFPNVAVFKIRGEIRLTVPYTSIKKIERID